jgi:hypothetical protein
MCFKTTDRSKYVNNIGLYNFGQIQGARSLKLEYWFNKCFAMMNAYS